jgi:hypothetical protein
VRHFDFARFHTLKLANAASGRREWHAQLAIGCLSIAQRFRATFVLAARLGNVIFLAGAPPIKPDGQVRN